MHALQELGQHPNSLALTLWGLARLSVGRHRWRPATPLLNSCCKALVAEECDMSEWGDIMHSVPLQYAVGAVQYAASTFTISTQCPYSP